jgi:hypothetical protein
LQFCVLYSQPWCEPSNGKPQVLCIKDGWVAFFEKENVMKKFLILLSALLLSVQAQAALVGVSGQGLIVSPLTVQEDSVLSLTKKGYFQFGFNEAQGVTLNRTIDVRGGTIAKGTKVDSHLVFLNTKGGLDRTKTATWEFSGDVLGVMTDSWGKDMAATNDLFAFGKYFQQVTDHDPIASQQWFKNLGLEGGGDFANYSGNVLKLGMHVTEPGDWIRVITVSAVPVPAALFLFAPALLGFLGLRRKVSGTVA